MKKLILNLTFLLFMAYAITSCKFEDNNYVRYQVLIPLTYWNLPDTSKVSTPFNLILNASITNSCTHDLGFEVVDEEAFKKRVIASCIYENRGEQCNPIELPYDSTVIITPNSLGKYYYYFLNVDEVKHTLVYTVDSIVIVP